MDLKFKEYLLCYQIQMNIKHNAKAGKQKKMKNLNM